MFYKKLLALSLVVVLAFTACSKGDESKEPTSTPTPTEAPVVDQTPDAQPPMGEETPDAQLPEQEGSGEEEIPGVDAELEGQELVADATLEEIHNKIKENLGDNYVATMSYDSQMVEEMFGVSADWYDAAIAQGPMMSAHNDKFLAFHATEGNLENIEKALQTFSEQIKTDFTYPMHVTKSQGCVVETVGDYVFFVMLGFIDDMAYDEESEMIAAYTDINNSLIDIAKEVIGQ